MTQSKVNPYQFVVIDDYLSEMECKRLLEDATDYLELVGSSVPIHGGRVQVVSTSSDFRRLLEQSQLWSELDQKLRSYRFIQFLESELGRKTQEGLRLVNLFHSKFGGLRKIQRFAQQTPVSRSSLKLILAVLLVRSYFYFCRQILHCLGILRHIRFVEVLYDFSISKSGYKREIHRDSDSRIIVFVLYLSDLDMDQGGLFQVFKAKGSSKFKPQPDESEVELCTEIQPKAGRLLLFENSEQSYHAVSELIDESATRTFLYGAVTQLGGRGRHINLSGIQLRTEFLRYQ